VAYGQAAEKFVVGRMPRQQFQEQDNQFNRRRDEIAEKINQIIKNL
jgi:hypothetical protein